MTKIRFKNGATLCIEGKEISGEPAQFRDMMQDAALHLPDIEAGWLPSVELYIAFEFKARYGAEII